MQKVLLTIKGNQLEGDPGEYIELTTEGRLFRDEKNGYSIEFEEGDLTGSEGTTKILLEDGNVTLSRNGGVDTHMVFSKNSVYESNLSTPFGMMRMSILALQIESELYEKYGSLSLEYGLSMGDQYSVNKLDLSFKNIDELIN